MLAALMGVLSTVVVTGPAAARTEHESTTVVDLPGGRAIMSQIAHNPERHEFLAVWRSRFGTEDVSAVRLDRNGHPLGDPFVVAPTQLTDKINLINSAPAVAYNPTTNEYVVVYQRQDLTDYPTGGQGSHIYARRVSATGALVGAEVQVSPDFSTYWFCSANSPSVAYDVASGGYMVAYFKHNFHAQGDCSGLTVAHSYRTLIQPLSGSLVPGALKMAPVFGPRNSTDRPQIEAHPTNGTFLVFEATGLNEGHAYLYDRNVTLLRDIHVRQPESAGNFSNHKVAADPVTGNWLLTWRQSRVNDTMAMVLDAGGAVVSPMHVGLSAMPTVDLAAVGDGTWVGIATGSNLVHFGADGTAVSVEKLPDFRDGNGLSFALGGAVAVDRSGGTPRAVALGRDTVGLGLELAVATADVYPPGNLPVVPARLLETRSGAGMRTVDGDQQGIGKRRAGSVTAVQVAGRGGVPAGATAAVLNVTQAEAEGPGHLTVFPCDAKQPNASSLNYAGGGADASAVFVKLSATGTACVFTHAAAHLIVDVNSFVPARGSITPVVPARLLETRSGPGMATVDGGSQGIGRVAAGSVTRVTVTGRGRVAKDAEAVLVNVTTVAPGTPTYVTVYPCGEKQPHASNLNANAGQVVNNLALAKVGTNGQICLYSLADSDLIVDVSGFVPAGGGLRPIVPARVLETRSGPNDTTIDGRFEGDGPLRRTGAVTRLDIAGRGGVPDGATGVMLNTTAIAPVGPGYLILFPCDAQQPNASNVNYAGGDVVANAVFVKLDPRGEVCVYTYADTHAVIDVVGYTLDR